MWAPVTHEGDTYPDMGVHTRDDLGTLRTYIRAMLRERIRRCGSKWCLYAKSSGKLLGKHDTKEDAEDQEAAIHASGG